jgi:hypothetical protein
MGPTIRAYYTYTFNICKFGHHDEHDHASDPFTYGHLPYRYSSCHSTSPYSPNSTFSSTDYALNGLHSPEHVSIPFRIWIDAVISFASYDSNIISSYDATPNDFPACTNLSQSA